MQPTPPTATSAGFTRPALAKPRIVPNAGPSTARSKHMSNPNPTPAATPPASSTAYPRHATKTSASNTPAFVARNGSTSLVSSSQSTRPAQVQTASTSRRPPTFEAIDVDKIYEKYTVKPEDSIMTIDVETFRQSVRVKSKGKEREGEVEIVTQRTTTASAFVAAPQPSRPPQAAPSAYVEHPSMIGSAISAMKAKRALANLQQQPSTPHNQKRRRFDEAEQRREPPRHEQPVAGPSRLRGATVPTPNAVASSSSHAPPRAGSLKRKPPAVQADDDDDDDLMIISDFPSGSNNFARKRPKHMSVQLPSDQSQAQRSKSSSVQAAAQMQTQTKRTYDVIELSSDGEVIEILTPPKKKSKTISRSFSPIEILSDSDDLDCLAFDDVHVSYHAQADAPPPISSESDSSDDEEWGLPWMDLNDPGRWKPMPVNSNSMLDDTLANTLGQLDIADSQPERVPPPILYIPPDTSMFDPPLRRGGYPRESPRLAWDMLAVKAYVFRRPRPFAYALPSQLYLPSWNQEFGLHRLRRAFHDPSEFDPLKKAPGCINRIEQKGSWTVTASGCIGGLPDVPDEQPNPYNRQGSLMTWNGELDIPEGHQVKKSEPEGVKHYAVHDVKFDPLREVFVSSGADRRVLSWSLYDADEDPNNMAEDPPQPSKPRWTKRVLKAFKHTPHELSFKPNSSLLAVGVKKVYLYSLTESVAEKRGAFPIHRPGEPYHVGAIAWGSQSSSNHLFASSEPEFDNVFEGLHKVFDLQSKSLLYQFDAPEAGDTLCIGPAGDALALTTRGQGNQPILRLYDIARRNGSATSTIKLEPYPALYPGFEGEVNCSTFSPDGLLLALARSDNQTHVYDVRYLGRGPIYRYEHTGECRAASQTDRYGVVKAQWLQSARSRRIALVTGGDDGCVRVWDPQISAADPKNGTVVAEVNSDIGHFSIGDPFAEEHRLIVGDCGGEIYFFDNII